MDLILSTNEIITAEDLVPEQLPMLTEAETAAQAPLPTTLPPIDIALEDEIEEELIIEDFTIDGICGVY